MQKTLIGAWPLFFGVLLIMTGNGLQGTLLGVRATQAGFDNMTTGLVMSMYYLGYSAGSLIVPKFVREVGHIRVFAAMASLGSTVVLLHGIFVDPWFWAFGRIITGFCFASLFIVIESWFNDISTAETRGRILSLYAMALYGSLTLGQYLLNLSSTETINLFVLVSVLVSVALVPISLSKREAPALKTPKRIKIKDLYRISPLGIVGVTVSGFCAGATFTIGPVYAIEQGMNAAQIANFMAAIIAGGFLGQYPIGYLSDHIGRRPTLLIISLLVIVTSVVCFFTYGITYIFYPALIAWGAGVLGLYSVATAYTNDHVEADQYVAVSASLVLMNGLGALLGPYSSSLLMQFFGVSGFFATMFIAYLGFITFLFYRSRVRQAVPIEDQVQQLNMPQRATPYVASIIKDEWDNTEDSSDESGSSDKEKDS